MYTPDCWVIVELYSSEHPLQHRVLCGWYGGYGGGDSWKMSSGVVKIVETPTHWVVHNQSGSIYELHKGCERVSGYTGSVLNRFVSQNTTKMNIKRISMESILETYRA